MSHVVTLHYYGPLRHAAGLESETVTVTPGQSVGDLIATLSDAHEKRLEPLLFSKSGELSASIRIVVNDETVEDPAVHELKAGDKVSLIAAISGG